MPNQPMFPYKPTATLTREALVDYLLQYHSRGYQVFQDESLNGPLELVLTEMHCIRFISNGGKVQLQGCTLNHAGWVFDVSSLAELQKAVDYIAHLFIGDKLKLSPTSARVVEGAIATNLATISNLVGTSAIEAIFDPYLKNRSLTALIDILSFGAGSISNGVRVLSTNKTTSGQIPKLTKVGFEAWLSQLGITGEIRVMGSSEHRRFILLSSEQSLLLGPSLNSIHKNEAVRLEPGAYDQTFFNQVWSQATLLI